MKMTTVMVCTGTRLQCSACNGLTTDMKMITVKCNGVHRHQTAVLGMRWSDNWYENDYRNGIHRHQIAELGMK